MTTATVAIIRLQEENERLRASLKKIATMKPSELAPDTTPGLVHHGPALLLANCQREARYALRKR